MQRRIGNVRWGIAGLLGIGILINYLEGTVGTVGSIMNFFNNLAGIAAPIAAGFIFQSTGSFAANFLVAGAILVLGIICFLFLLGRIEQIQQPQIGPEEPRIGPEVGPVASKR
jgi:hypothetical protein